MSKIENSQVTRVLRDDELEVVSGGAFDCFVPAINALVPAVDAASAQKYCATGKHFPAVSL